MNNARVAAVLTWIPPLAADFEGPEKPMSWEELSAEENLDGLSQE